MDLKDWFYLIGILLTFIVSVFSLFVNIKNRRNAIREHLYKEQLTFFLSLSSELHMLLEAFYEVERESTLSSANDEKIESLLAKISYKIESFHIITPDEIDKHFTDITRIIEKLHTKSLKEEISREDILIYQNSYLYVYSYI